MHWPNGKRELKKYNTIEDSYLDCEKLWNRVYGKEPNLQLAMKWTGYKKPENKHLAVDWLNNFYYFYNKF